MKCYPNAKYFEEYKVGQVFNTSGRTVTEADLVNYAGISSDFNPLHMDVVYAEANEHGARIAHGGLIFSLTGGLVNLMGWFDDSVIAFLGVNMDFRKAVKIGDTIYVRLVVTDTKLTSKPGRGIVFFDVETINQKDEVVLKGAWKLLFRSKPQVV
ncbi:MAG: MaoC/PaaZ C-terminal domain-containing protein [Christensenellales bacterium]